MTVTRRWVMAGGAAGAGAALLPSWMRPAEAQSMKTRYSATSPQGKAMLVKYARAVDIMRHRIPAGDPRHWNFQWYSHFVPGPQRPWNAVQLRKAQVLKQVYGTDRGAHYQLADAMWDGCQAHGDNPGDPAQFQETFFLPWHRYFVYYFEQILRGVLQDADFTLPYWNYLGGSVEDLKIPPEFYQDRNSPLYQPNRNAWVNAGERIDKENPGAINLSAFNYPYYISADSSTGFCPTLDGNPHGLVHDFTGNGTNMGYVPTAANDPVFWLHHANIDRLWASWNRLGRQNPTWVNRQFPFADGNGRRVMVNLNGARDTAPLGYVYDTYQQVPTNEAGGEIALAPNAVGDLPLLAASPAGTTEANAPGVTLAVAGPTRVVLAAAAGRSAGPSLFAAVPRTQSVFLNLYGVDVKDGFNGTYNIYLGLPEGTAPGGAGSANYVATFGAFMLKDHGGHAGHMGHMPSLSFDVTRVVAALTGAESQPSVTFQPLGQIGNAPTVASISLVAG